MDFPIYKSHGLSYQMIISESEYIEANPLVPEYSRITELGCTKVNCPKNIETMLADGIDITEQEFMIQYNKALGQLHELLKLSKYQFPLQKAS